MSSILQMSIVWYITQEKKSATLLSFATLIGYLPQALLGLFIGVYIDRYNRKTVMILSVAGTALVSLVLVIIGLFGKIPIWLICVVLFIRSIGSAFHAPALQAVTPSLVPKDQLTRYAGFSQGFKSFSMVISPALAALLFSIWKLNVIIFLDVVGALLAIGILLIIKISSNTKEKLVAVHKCFGKRKKDFLVLKEKSGL